MRLFGPSFALSLFSLGFGTVACDSSAKEPNLGLPKTKSISELKQESKSEMTKEELEAARRQAGFKSPEEQRAEALAEYVKSERAYVKGHLKEFREMTGAVRKHLETIEQAAPKWAKAKDPDAAFGKFKDKYQESIKGLNDAYDKARESGRGGDTFVELSKAIGGWQDLNADLGPQIAEAEGFTVTLTAIREQLDAVDAQLKAIETDDTIEAEAP